MDSSDDEDDPRSLAKSHINLLVEKCTTLSKKVMNVDSPNDTAAENVMDAGIDILTIYFILQLHYAGLSAVKALKDTLELVEGLWKVDINDTDNILQEFLYQFQIFAHQNGLFKLHRKDIMEFQLTSSALVDEMEKSWNRDRLVMSASRTGKDEDQTVETAMDEMPDESDKSSKVDHPKRSFLQSGLTPEKKQVKFVKQIKSVKGILR